jgi:hypothetical protein
MRRALFFLAVGSLVAAPLGAATVHPAGAAEAECLPGHACVWPNPHYTGKMVDLEFFEGECVQGPFGSALSNYNSLHFDLYDTPNCDPEGGHTMGAYEEVPDRRIAAASLLIINQQDR